MTTNTNRLPALPSLPSSRSRALVSCACGCGRTTGHRFAPGHDARSKGLILRVVAGVMSLDDVAAWGGEATREAMIKLMADRATMARWEIEIPEAAAEPEAAEVA